MAYQPYYCPNENCNPQSYIRIFHASPDAPAVDIYANGNLIAENLSFGNFTEYISVMSGNYNIEVFPAGEKNNPVIDTSINIPANSIFTVTAIGRLDNISLFPVEDPRIPIQRNRAYVRFVHLSPDAPNVDIALPDSTKLFTDVSYKEIEDYIPLRPGTYTLEVKPTGSEERVLFVPNVRLTPDRFYTVYAIGLVAGTPPLQVVIPLDGNSYLRF